MENVLELKKLVDEGKYVEIIHLPSYYIEEAKDYIAVGRVEGDSTLLDYITRDLESKLFQYKDTIPAFLPSASTEILNILETLNILYSKVYNKHGEYYKQNIWMNILNINALTRDVEYEDKDFYNLIVNYANMLANNSNISIWFAIKFIYDKDYDGYSSLKTLISRPEYNPNELIYGPPNRAIPIWFVIVTNSTDPVLTNYILNDTRIAFNPNQEIFDQFIVAVAFLKDLPLIDRVFRAGAKLPQYYRNRANLQRFGPEVANKLIQLYNL